MYLIIDRDYRIFQTDVLSDYIKLRVRLGKLSVVRLSDLKGMNIDGSWEKLPDLELMLVGG